MNEENNTIFVSSKKPAKTYAFSAVMLCKVNNEILFKARGKAIQTCVDASQMAVKRFLTGWVIKHVELGTESIEVDDRRNKGKKIKINISTINIQLVREVKK